jgi:hypothetical protein
MLATKSVKRHSPEDIQKVITKLKKYSFDEFHNIFKEGRAPSFDEIEGDTLGSFLALNPKAGWWRRASLTIAFDNPLACWAGKRFITPFTEEQMGKGVNLFRNRIFPERFGIDTLIDNSLLDQKPCLAVTYPHFPSSLFGLRDELRIIDDGVLLGQGHHKLPWGKQYSLQGYFVLAALAKPEDAQVK